MASAAVLVLTMMRFHTFFAKQVRKRAEDLQKTIDQVIYALRFNSGLLKWDDIINKYSVINKQVRHRIGVGGHDRAARRGAAQEAKRGGGSRFDTACGRSQAHPRGLGALAGAGAGIHPSWQPWQCSDGAAAAPGVAGRDPPVCLPPRTSNHTVALPHRRTATLTTTHPATTHT